MPKIIAEFLVDFPDRRGVAALVRNDDGSLALDARYGRTAPSSPFGVLAFRLMQIGNANFDISEAFSDDMKARVSVNAGAGSATLEWSSVWPFDVNPIQFKATFHAKVNAWVVVWAAVKGKKYVHFEEELPTKLTLTHDASVDAHVFKEAANRDEELLWRETLGEKDWPFPSDREEASAAISAVFNEPFRIGSLKKAVIGYCREGAFFAPVGTKENWVARTPLDGAENFAHSDENSQDADPDDHVAPVLFFRSQLENLESDQIPEWQAVVQSWLPQDSGNVIRAGYSLRGGPYVAKLWNDACTARRDRSAVLPGTPASFLPKLELDKQAILDFSSFEWLLEFEQNNGKWRVILKSARLLQRPRATTEEFGFLSLAMTCVDGTSATLKLRIKVAGETSEWSPPTNGRKMPENPAKVISSALGDAGALIVANFNVLEVVCAPLLPVRLGSVQVTFKKSDSRKPLTSVIVVLRLHGSWTSNEALKAAPDFYLQDLPCVVQPLSGQDASAAENNVLLGQDEAFTRRAFVEGDAFAINAEANGNQSMQMLLSIRERHGLDRNPVTEFKLKRASDFNGLARHLAIQFKPFAVAVVERQKFSEQAEELVAQWRSDDPEGAQWRWGVREYTVSLPPSVSEEMERGVRFWKAPEHAATPLPYINGDAPLKYRFTTPAVLRLTPGESVRRYNRAAQNLDWVMSNAEVNAFRAEVMYPVVARFERDKDNLPRIRVREATDHLGAVPEPLAPLDGQPFGSRFPTSLLPENGKQRYERLRRRHAISAFNHRSRLTQYELFDHHRPDGLALDRNVAFEIRKSKPSTPGAPNDSAVSLDPLPIAFQPADDLGREWVWDRNGKAGGIRTGILHSLEFPSELTAVLRNLKSSLGIIDSLAFSALGISGTSSVSLDEGRTQFSVVKQDGQTHRLVKTRIGRIGVLWNRAKHVIVYERSVLPSQQFEAEQSDQTDKTKHYFDGWPIPRKMEEYVEVLEPVRRFAEEVEADGDNKAACIDGSEFVSTRMLVNGSWGRDLGDGYEIPLWDKTADPGIYVKPNVTLRGRVDASTFVRLGLKDPSQLVFFSNTQAGTGANSDQWDARATVDYLNAARPGLPSRDAGKTADDVLTRQTSSASTLLLGWDRFYLWVEGEALDLVSDRSEKPVFVRPERVLLSRSSQTSAVPEDQNSTAVITANHAETLQAVVASTPADGITPLPGAIADTLKAFRGDVERSLRDALAQFTQGIPDCAALKTAVVKSVDTAHQLAKTNLDQRFDEAATALTQIAQPLAKVEVEAAAQLANAQLAFLKPFAAIDAARNDWREQLLKAQSQIADGQLEESLRKKLRELHAQALSEHRRLFGYLIKSFDTASITPIQQWLTDWNTYATEIARAIHDGQNNITAIRSRLELQRDNLVNLRNVRLPELLQSNQAAGLPKSMRGLILDSLNAMLDLTNTVIGYCDKTTGKLSTAAPLPATMLSAAQKLGKKADQCLALVNGLNTAMTALISTVVTQADTALTDLRNAIDANVGANIRQKIDEILNADAQVAGWLSLTRIEYEAKLNIASSALQTVLTTTLEPILAATDHARIALEGNRGVAMVALDQLKADLTAAINAAAADCQQLETTVREGLVKAEKAVRVQLQEVEKQIGKSLDDVVQSEMGQKLKQSISDASKMYDTGSKYVKLAKLLGSPPALPTLTFNLDRVDYVFDDVEQQILTSPMAAHLREIDGALNELGLSIPTRKILDQLVPDSLKNIDIKKVFKDLAGMRFDHLFPSMKLPALPDDSIKVTHDVNTRARTAWVKAVVDVPFTEELTAFGGPVPLRVANARFLAEVTMEAGPSGTRSRAVGSIKGDWSLTVGSERLATFRDVAIKFSSERGLEIDISIERMTLHPTVSFVSEYAKSLGEKIPPGVEIVRENGKPVGAKADVINPIPGFNVAAFAVGPFLLASGFSLMLKSTGAPQGVTIRTHVSVGSRKQPFMVQIGWLSGAAWLEASAQLNENGKLLPTAEVGFAAGTGRSVTIAGVAHASYSFLFFVNARADANASSMEVGIRISGEARLLGYLSASVLMELIARQENGQMKGHGTLDVEIDVCWNYSVHIVRHVEQEM